MRDEGPQPRRARRDDLACDDVGVDDGESEGRETVRDGGFACRDAAGEADDCRTL